MRDFRTGRKKKLDLVVCRPRALSKRAKAPITFAEQADQIGAVLNDAEKDELRALPSLRQLPVGAVHIALEAKACMTAFIKAMPRLYDELNSSHAAIHGNSQHTIGAGLAIVNIAPEFISPDRNKFSLSTYPPQVSRHDQPREALAVIRKLGEIPRRVRDGEDGFDAFAIVVLNCKNDGSPVRLVENPPAPQPGDIHNYEWTVQRLAQAYEQKYHNIAYIAAND